MTRSELCSLIAFTSLSKADVAALAEPVHSTIAASHVPALKIAKPFVTYSLHCPNVTIDLLRLPFRCATTNKSSLSMFTYSIRSTTSQLARCLP